jgi:hypothetical protein
MNFQDFLNEKKKITLKRSYTENYPSITAGMTAAVRNKMIEAVADSKLTQEEFNAILSELSNDSKRWMNRNSKYFSVSEDGITLSSFGKKVFNTISVNEDFNEEESVEEGRNAFITAARAAKAEGLKEFEFKGKTFPVTVKDVSEEAPEIEEVVETKNLLVAESFSDFVKSISVGNLNEALKSAVLSQLFNTKMAGARGANGIQWEKSVIKDIPSAFYNMTQIALDQVGDEDLIHLTPAEAHKVTKMSEDRHVIFYIVDQEKENPYSSSQNTEIITPGILAIVKGNEFIGTAHLKGYEQRNTGLKGRILKKTSADDSLGISKKYKGDWDATGLYNPKRISDVADRAIAMDINVLKDKYSTAGKRAQRAESRMGAIAFKSAADFKKENLARYKQIIADKVAKLPIDDLVKDAIDALTKQIQNGFDKQHVESGELVIGQKPSGRNVTVRDAANHMTNLLDRYQRYVYYSNESRSSISDYYKTEMKKLAVDVKSMIDDIAIFNYGF